MLDQIWDYPGLPFQNHGKNQENIQQYTGTEEIALTSTDSSLQRCSKEGQWSRRGQCSIFQVCAVGSSHRNVGECLLYSAHNC